MIIIHNLDDIQAKIQLNHNLNFEFKKSLMKIIYKIDKV